MGSRAENEEAAGLGGHCLSGGRNHSHACANSTGAAGVGSRLLQLDASRYAPSAMQLQRLRRIGD